jgi:hypothetical protein
VVISTNILVASTVRAKVFFYPEEGGKNPRNVGTYAPHYKRPFSFMHFIVPRSGSWSCLRFGKANCPCAKHEGMRERRGIVPLNPNLHLNG